MTVSSSTNRVSYSGNGTLTAFAYTFKIFDEDDLTVILRASDGTETVQTITTHYTVSGVGDAGGGNVTFVTAPASGVTVVILREQPLTQGLDLVPNDPFPAASLEEALDKLVFMTQKHEEELGRAIKASRTNTLTGSEFTISAADRANKVFSFDSSGDLSVTQELGTFKGDWAASTAYVERDLVRDTSDGSIYIVNSAHTSSGTTPLDTNTNSSKYDAIFDVGAMIAGTVTMTGDLTVQGNTTLGDASSDSITMTGTAANLRMSTTNVTDILDEDTMSSDSATALATQQSIKAYVDSQVATADTLTEILGNGNTTSGANIQMTTTDELQFRDTALKISSSVDGQLDIDADTKVEITAPTVDINATNANFTGHALFGDDDRVKFGDSQDAYLEWTSVGYFTARSTGRFDIQSDGNDLRLVSNTNIGLTVNHTGGTPAVHLYNSGTERLATTSTGIDVTGTITSDSIAIDTDVLYVDSTNDRVGINTTSPDRDLTVIGTGHFGATTAGVALSNSASVGVIYGMTSTGASFTDLQITSVGSASHLYFDADGTIGINNTSPNDWVSTGTQFVIGGGSGHNGMTIASGSTSYGTIYFADGTTGDALDAGYIRYQHQYDRMSFVTSSSSTDAIRITSAGDVGIGLTGDPSTKLEVNGTVTADGLTVDGDAKFTDISPAIILSESDTTNVNTRLGNYGGDFSITTVNDSDVYVANRLTVDHATGDISFYEDTGTTAKFFWDASAESLGIGTTSPTHTISLESAYPYISFNETDQSQKWVIGGASGNFVIYDDTDAATRLAVDGDGNIGIGGATTTGWANKQVVLDGGANTSVAYVMVNDTTGRASTDGAVMTLSGSDFYLINRESANMIFRTANTERMRIDSSGNVGIGNTNPSDYDVNADNLVVGTTSGNNGISIASGTTGLGSVFFADATSGVGLYRGLIQYNHSSDYMRFFTTSAERMRIDSSGNLLVGKTSTNTINTVGHDITDHGEVMHTTDGGTTMYLNRKTSDGTIIDLRKNGTTVGSIAVGNTDNLVVSGNSSHSGLMIGTDHIIPYANGVIADGTEDLGYSSFRWRNLYLSGGVYLGGTGSANLLDDYESGSVTLTMGGGTSNPSTTQSTTGQYIKVGSLVTVWFKFSNKDNSGASGTVEIDGLPFTVTSLLDGYGTAWGGRDSAGGTGHKVYLAGLGTTSAKMIDGNGNNVTWSSTGSGTYQGGMIIYRT